MGKRQAGTKDFFALNESMWWSFSKPSSAERSAGREQRAQFTPGVFLRLSQRDSSPRRPLAERSEGNPADSSPPKPHRRLFVVDPRRRCGDSPGSRPLAPRAGRTTGGSTCTRRGEGKKRRNERRENEERVDEEEKQWKRRRRRRGGEERGGGENDGEEHGGQGGDKRRRR